MGSASDVGDTTFATHNCGSNAGYVAQRCAFFFNFTLPQAQNTLLEVLAAQRQEAVGLLVAARMAQADAEECCRCVALA